MVGILGSLISGALPIIFRAIDKAIPDKDLAEKTKHELAMMQAQGQLTEFEVAIKAVVAEAQSEHVLTATWRPITMLVFVFIIANNFIIAPYMQAIFGWYVPLEMGLDTIPEPMWTLITVGLGGYVFGRSAEKFAENLRKDPPKYGRG